VTYTYQWLHCTSSSIGDCQPIDDETDPGYVIDSVYAYERIRVKVTATNAVGSSSSTSTPTGQIVALAPSQTGSMVIDGLPRVGNTISLNVGDWAGTGPIDYQYQWQRCDAAAANCADIPGAGQDDYELTAQDLGSRLRVVTVVSNRYFVAGSFTSPTSTAVTAAPDTVATDITPVAQTLDPTDDEHIEQTAQIINKISPYHSPDAPCNAVCETGAAQIQAMAASLPPEDDAFGPLSSRSNVNQLLGGSDTTKRIVRGGGGAVIAAGLVPLELPTVAAIGVAAAVYSVVVYANVMGGPRYSEIETLARTGSVPVCGNYDWAAYPCPIIAAQSVYHRHGDILNTDGATMPYDGYVYRYKISNDLGYFTELGTCANYTGHALHAPAQFVGRVNAGNSTLCTDIQSHSPNQIAVGPESIYPQGGYTYDPPTSPPAGPGDVQMGQKPGWTDPGPFEATKSRVRDTLQGDELKAYLAWLEDPRCHPNPLSDTVTIPTINDDETGQHYANCLKTLGPEPSVRAKPIADADADTSKLPGAALSSTPAAGTDLAPDEPVTVIINPAPSGPGGPGGDAGWLRDIEAGLIAHNPELVATIPDFETEVVSRVALDCAKNVKNAEASAALKNVDSPVSEEDCGDEEHRGLPMYVSGITTPQATQNDLNALKRNPLWVGLNRRLVPEQGNTLYPPSWWFSRLERRWYKNQPGCAATAGFAFPSCDEFPYFATLQGQFGLLKTETPHVETVELAQNVLQGSLLSKFYLGGGNGGYPWHGCNLIGQPRTDVAVSADRFLALPNKILPTYGICNATP
jgi:hypothetical protein